MRLDTWIKTVGPKNIAKAMKVDPSTVSIWRSGKSMPSAKRLATIYRLSGEQVTHRELVEHFANSRRRNR